MVLKFETKDPSINPLMGGNQPTHLKLFKIFTKEQAIEYAKKIIFHSKLLNQKEGFAINLMQITFLKLIMWRSYFTERKWLLWSWGGFAFIILSLLAQTYIDVKINEWYKGFYDLLQKAPERELSEFYDGIALFAKLAIPYVIIYTVTNYFTRLWAFRWREAMTFSYMPYWRQLMVLKVLLNVSKKTR